jgi:hypothetical protein
MPQGLRQQLFRESLIADWAQEALDRTHANRCKAVVRCCGEELRAFPEARVAVAIECIVGESRCAIHLFNAAECEERLNLDMPD